MQKQMTPWFLVLALMATMAASLAAQSTPCEESKIPTCNKAFKDGEKGDDDDDAEADFQFEAAAPAKAAMPRGVYALIGYNQTPEQTTWDNPCLAGVVIRTYWECLNPEQNVYKFEALRKIFDAANLNNKKIHLIIVPGTYSPQWVKRFPGVDKHPFPVAQGFKKCTTEPLPLPWNETYLNLWDDFVTKVGDEFGNDPALAYMRLAIQTQNRILTFLSPTDRSRPTDEKSRGFIRWT
ncbi:MAG: hypothetical protein ACREOO_17225 [bacterium]